MASDDEPECSDHSPHPAIVGLWTHMFGQLRATSPGHATRHLAYLNDVGRESYASMCAGSESPSLVLEGLSDFVRNGYSPACAHSTEIDTKKNLAIQSIFPHDDHFGDVCEVASSKAVMCRKSGRKKRVKRDPRGCFAGFSCKDFSSLGGQKMHTKRGNTIVAKSNKS